MLIVTMKILLRETRFSTRDKILLRTLSHLYSTQNLLSPLCCSEPCFTVSSRLTISPRPSSALHLEIRLTAYRFVSRRSTVPRLAQTVPPRRPVGGRRRRQRQWLPHRAQQEAPPSPARLAEKTQIQNENQRRESERGTGQSTITPRNS